MRTVFLDLETTDLDPRTDEILEIGILDDTGPDVRNRLLDSVVRPERQRRWPGAGPLQVPRTPQQTGDPGGDLAKQAPGTSGWATSAIATTEFGSAIIGSTKPLAIATPRKPQMATITINLPDALAERVGGAARAVHRPLEDVLTAMLDGVVPSLDDVPEDMPTELVEMTWWDDARLMEAADAAMPA